MCNLTVADDGNPGHHLQVSIAQKLEGIAALPCSACLHLELAETVERDLVPFGSGINDGSKNIVDIGTGLGFADPVSLGQMISVFGNHYKTSLFS